MLTPRQAEIARLLAKGYSYKRIATEQNIAVRTVINHVQQAARRIEGEADRPRDKVLIWFLSFHDDAA